MNAVIMIRIPFSVHVVLHSSLLVITSYLPRDCSLLGFLVRKEHNALLIPLFHLMMAYTEIFVRHTLIHTSKHLSVHALSIAQMGFSVDSIIIIWKLRWIYCALSSKNKSVIVPSTSLVPKNILHLYPRTPYNLALRITYVA